MVGRQTELKLLEKFTQSNTDESAPLEFRLSELSEEIVRTKDRIEGRRKDREK